MSAGSTPSGRAGSATVAAASWARACSRAARVDAVLLVIGLLLRDRLRERTVTGQAVAGAGTGSRAGAPRVSRWRRAPTATVARRNRSEERRVGKEGRYRW